jgi:peptidoglycan-associated lipoprotein
MKYTMLATALALALGGGIAAADDPPADNPPADTTQGSTTTTTTGTAGATAGATAGNTGASVSAGTTGTSTTATSADQEAKAIPSSDLLFDTNSSVLKPEASAKLHALATWAKCTPKGALILEGNADPRGTQNYNMKLAADRASVVRQKLIDMGVPSDRIVITVYGKNGERKPTFAERRRVTVRAAARPLQPADVTAQR